MALAAPDGKVAAVGVGTLTGVIGSCSQPTQLASACDGAGPTVALHPGDQLDVAQGPLFYYGQLHLRLRPSGGGAPVEALAPGGTGSSYLTVP